MALKGRIVHQEDAENPRTSFDNLCTMVCFHKRYNLGDKQTTYSSNMFSGWDEMEAAILKDNPKALILPLYLYDHSGITIRTFPFSCPWDSGQVGFVFVTYDAMKKEFGKSGAKRLSAKAKQKALVHMLAEVQTYDYFISGECYGYVIEDENGNEVDSCYGYYGQDDAQQALDEAMREQEQGAKC